MTQTNAEKQAKYRARVAEKFASQEARIAALERDNANLHARLDALESEMRMVKKGVGLALMAAMTMRFS